MSNPQVTITFAANVSGGTGFSGNIPTQTYTASNSPVYHDQISFTGGANTTVSIPTLPAQATWCRIVPASGAGNLFIKGANADTGIQISSTNETWLALSTAISSFVIYAGTTSTLDLYFF